MSFERKPFKKTIPFKKTFPATYSTDLLTYDEQIISELYSLISSGDYNDIKKFMMENNINNLNIKDENKNSILHEVLSNSNLSKFDKISLSKLLIQDGAPISIQNNKKITPLHLASKYHLIDIAKVILKNNTEYNLCDMSDMNALHHAVLPENTVCIKPYVHSNDLIPRYAKFKKDDDDEEKLNSQKIDKFLKYDLQNIVDYIQDKDKNDSDANNRDELELIKTIFSEVKYVKNKDTDKILEAFSSENFPNSTEQIKSKYITNLNDYIGSLLTKSKNELNLNESNLNDLELKDSSENTSYTLEKFIKYNTLNDFLTERELSLNNDIKNANEQLKKSNEKFIKELEKIEKYYNEIFEFINYTYTLANINGYDDFFHNILNNENKIVKHINNLKNIQFDEINLKLDNAEKDIKIINDKFINNLASLILNISVLHMYFYNYSVIFDNLEILKKYDINNNNNNNVKLNKNIYIAPQLKPEKLNNKNELNDLFDDGTIDPNNSIKNFSEIKKLKGNMLEVIDNIYNNFLSLNKQKDTFFEIINKNYSFKYIKINFFTNNKYEKKNKKFNNCLLNKIKINKEINIDTIQKFIKKYCGYDGSYDDKNADLKNNKNFTENVYKLLYLNIDDNNTLKIYSYGKKTPKKDGIFTSSKIQYPITNENIDYTGELEISNEDDYYPEIIGVEMDTLVYGIKYVIIKKIIAEILYQHELEQGIGKSVYDLTNNIFNDKNKSINIIMKEIYLKLIDDLFKKFISNNINNLSKNFINNSKENEILFINFSDNKFEMTKDEIIDNMNTYLSDKFDSNVNDTLPNVKKIYTDKYDHPQHIIINPISKESLCFDLDENIIDILIKAKVDPNKKDSMGNIPLIYAIDLKNISIIEKFLNSKIINLKSKNYVGLDCLNYSLYKIKNQKFNYWNYIDKKNIEIRDNIIKETNFRKTIIKTEKILEMVYYLVNHQFYLYSSELEESKLKNLKIKLDKIPFFENNFKSLDEDGLERIINKNNNKIDKLENTLLSLKNQLANLPDSFKKKIGDNIKEIMKEITRLNDINDKLKNKPTNDNKNINDIILSDIDVYKNYDKLIEKINQNIYYKTWDRNDIKNHKVLLLNNLLENKDIDIENSSISSLLNIYKNKINNYFDLDQMYSNENKTLKNVIDIINHVIQNTLSLSFFELLKKYFLVKFEIIKQQDEKVKENLSIDDIINNDLNEFLKKNTKNIIRFELNIKKNDDEELDTTLDILEKSLDIIMNNNKISINKDEKIIKDLIDYVLPYYEKNYKIYIIESKNLIDKFFRSVLDIQTNYEIYSMIKKEY